MLQFIRFYVFAFLQTQAAYDQMLRNEYGAVQQHLEPAHVKDILIPVPNDWGTIKGIVEKVKQLIEHKEQLDILSNETDEAIAILLDTLLGE